VTGSPGTCGGLADAVEIGESIMPITEWQARSMHPSTAVSPPIDPNAPPPMPDPSSPQPFPEPLPPPIPTPPMPPTPAPAPNPDVPPPPS